MRRLFVYGAQLLLIVFLARPQDSPGLGASPKSAAAYNNLGTSYFQQRQFARAADAFLHAKRLRPGDSEIAFNLALALYKLGDAERAIPYFEEGRQSSHAPDASLLLGICEFETRQWQRSIDVLEEYRKHAPANPQVLFILQQAYVRSGDAKSSLAAAAELLQAYPDSTYTHQMLGEAYDRDGDVDHAAEEFRLAIAGDPTAPQLNFMLGYVCWRWKRYTDAIAPLQAEVKINPEFARPYYYLGDIEFRKKDTARAMAFFRKALSLDHSYSEAQMGLGKCYLQSGRSADAIASLRKAEAGLGNTVEVHYWLGRALIQHGLKQEGEKELAKVKDLSAAQQQKMQEKFNGAPVGEIFPAPPTR
jgi:tetratricopeptide (TPR) repeat protein